MEVMFSMRITTSRQENNLLLLVYEWGFDAKDYLAC